MGVMETFCFAAIFLILAAPHTESLSIKRRSPRSSNDLTAALNVLRRHKRQASDVEYLRDYLIENQDRIPEPYLNVLNDNYDLNLGKFYPHQAIAENPIDEQMLIDAYKNYKKSESAVPYKSDNRNVKRSRTIPTKAELAKIFGNFNKAPERTHKRQTSVHHPDSEFASYRHGLEQKLKRNTESTSSVREISSKDMTKDHNDIKTAGQQLTPVSTDELKGVFGDDAENKESQSDSAAPTEQPVSGETQDKKTERSAPTEGERFQELTSYENLANIKEKKKRVEKRDYDSEIELSQSVLDLTRTVAALRDEVSRLKIAEALEDKENDLLASALKQATLGQLQGTEGNLKKEYLDIQNAIRVEEQLQRVRSPESLQDERPSQEEDEEIGVDDLPVADKRGNIPLGLATSEDANIGQWYRSPMDDSSAVDEEEADKTFRKFTSKVLANKQHLKENESEKVIEELVSNLNPTQRQELAEGYLAQGPYDEPSNENNCPGVNYLISQCSVAKMAGLEIDEDAENLCNRHEICYSCGGTLSFSQTTCDAGFRGDVIEICGEDTKCIENSAKFLWFLKSEHTYNYGYLDKCDSGCVRDFIKGL